MWRFALPGYTTLKIPLSCRLGISEARFVQFLQPNVDVEPNKAIFIITLNTSSGFLVHKYLIEHSNIVKHHSHITYDFWW